MESRPSLEDRMLRFFPSSEDLKIAVEIVKFLRSTLTEKHPEGYEGPKRSQIIRIVKGALDKKHGQYHAEEIINSVITQLEDFRVIRAHDYQRKDENRHYFLIKSYID